ncbi:SET and MYND domain-containing protein 4-like isoform X2 [Hylaeus anthracinus]|uniref:SET and MYND domain-containing protein 4-like isoform X2 n=1 Tax=Hylaeus volcanicus TaxID=313075 RepID=UPI0023B869F7|nr:SET and MYND domain-containing protein 4-like isoform X2 [Hylaeus volcanicus]XP_054013530.1 SET and MYND domain-containing protein 4-like isoform X2 [Hylaeus anthracinus]XP_054013531.1 SET and MYND domain-containing protein 4-like isoform X2 [Hylaeus anthracinus]
MDMDTARELVLTLKQGNKSHAGYGLQKECEALVGHILQNMVKSPLPTLVPETKNEEDSIRFREEGNQHFVMGDDNEAIKCYTMSLAYANDKELMSYAHANRSAALYRKQMYKQCLIDIDAALNLGYPEEKRKNLKERGAKAVEEIKKKLKIQKDDPIDTQKLMSMCLSEKITDQPVTVRYRNGNAESKKEINKDVNANGNKQESINGCDEPPMSNKEREPRYLADEGSLKLAYGPSKESPAASDGVSISFSEKYGRHLRATKEFKPGDVVSFEDPYAYVMYTQRYYTHCHHCLSRSYNLIPCTNCPMAQYCSEKCRTLSWEMAHQIECPILAVLGNLFNIDKDKVRMLTKIVRFLIMVTAKGEKIAELREDMKVAEINPDDRTAGFTDDGILDSNSARSALSLATNMSTRPLIGLSAFACISALGAILLATQTNFFCKKYEVDQLKDIGNVSDLKFCGSLMFRACVIMSSNCFTVQQEPGVKTGSGLYILHSLYNHSCAPNTFRHFEGLTMITRALEPINPGDQIFTGYGAAYAHMPRSERREKIMQDYFFECNCPACDSDWPMYNEILQHHVGSICKNKELVEKLKPYKQRLVKNMYDIDAVKSVLGILYKEVSQPCEEIVHAEQYLKSYYLAYIAS